ncbi:hypothetical protein C7960_0296 [Methanohalophilus euhalobius]|jgi:hypothetical protein|uniref:Uncharacterized protein n=1 Tax=Methanohalophilus euhalobius TaxID=51203 RepID=A0A285ERC0_9EURY|nr:MULTISPECIES: hypothetical protein [Methanohalophilus]ODV49424.1 MAG: hypothetical protein A8273_1212 [Methanohalophilus sp. 2-GBenrich]TCL11185.1 hypothetical protein C7960_0296 [Methanohalophilus euhalobius]SNY00531.1 hypothetical protein SAMN06295989_101263 [Methanohalophilus euhalobius]
MKLALTHDNIDILRIIPISKGNTIDFKFSLLGNYFQISYWQLGKSKPERCPTTSEISYHSSSRDKKKKPVVHIKDKSSEIVYQHSFHNIIDMKPSSEFPMPLCKISVKEPGVKEYTQKNEHVLFDFSNKDYFKCNTVEIFIISKDQELNISKVWPTYDILWQTSRMDYLISGPELSDCFLNMLNAGPKVCREMNTSFSDFNLIFKPYHDDNVTENSISFYENYDYITILATSPVQLTDNNTKKAISPVAPAFAFDLEWQLNNGLASRKEADQMKRKFDKMLDRVNQLKIHRHGFCIPQG